MCFGAWEGGKNKGGMSWREENWSSCSCCEQRHIFGVYYSTDRGEEEVVVVVAPRSQV